MGLGEQTPPPHSPLQRAGRVARVTNHCSKVGKHEPELKGTKLDLPIFYWPARQLNQSWNPMATGLPRGLCGEADEDAITRYHDDELYAGGPNVSVFATYTG